MNTAARSLVPVLALSVLAASVHADNVATLDITGLRIQNNTTQNRTSAPDTIDPANNYTVTNSNITARGQGGILGTLFPTATPIQTILDTLAPGQVWPTTGDVPNPAGTHPFVLATQAVNETTTVLGINVTLVMTITAQINADNTVSYSITGVTVSPSILVGSLVFTSGTVTVTRNPVTASCDSIDFNGDGLFPDTQDIDDFLRVFAGSPCPTGTCGDIDFNNDGLFPDTEDIDAFIRVFAGGAC
jgi:hypothetical protein